jgi:putative hydrolase of HD superfamily
MKDSLRSEANLLYEVGMLSHTPRSYFPFLGSGSQSVASHIHRVCYVGLILAHLEGVDAEKVLKMCLFHDLEEARLGDLNYVNQKYIKADGGEAVAAAINGSILSDLIVDMISEYEAKKSPESLVAKAADQIEFILSLKEQKDVGNPRVDSWIALAVPRLKTNSAKELVEEILKTPSDDWWFSNKDDQWWINRNKS